MFVDDDPNVFHRWRCLLILGQKDKHHVQVIDLRTRHFLDLVSLSVIDEDRCDRVVGLNKEMGDVEADDVVDFMMKSTQLCYDLAIQGDLFFVLDDNLRFAG